MFIEESGKRLGSILHFLPHLKENACCTYSNTVRKERES